MRSRRKSLCLFAVWVLIEACEALDVNNCLVPGRFLTCEAGDPELPRSHLLIQCTATEVTATFRYDGSETEFLGRISNLGVAWICQSEEVYECDFSLLDGIDVEFSLNITDRGGWGSSCTMQACVKRDSRHFLVTSSNVCKRGSATTSSETSTVMTTIATETNQTTAIGSATISSETSTVMTTVATETNQTTVIEDGFKIQTSTTDTSLLIATTLVGVLILLVLLVIAVIMPLVSVVHLRMRKFSHNWQAYGNPELPFDPHYTPVDIEKPSFSPTPRLSLLSVDMFQNLYMARTNHLANGNLYTEPPSFHPYIRYDQSEAYSTLDTRSIGDESEKGTIGYASSEVSIPHTSTPLDDDDTLGKSCTVSESSCRSPSVQYIQDAPILTQSQSPRNDGQDNLQANLSNDGYSDSSLIGTRDGVASCDDTGDSLHFWEQNSLPLHSLSDPFSSACAELMEANTIQLDKEYISSESGYIQSHDTNCSTVQSLFTDEDTDCPDLDNMSNQGLIITTQPAQMPLIEQQTVESPTTLLDNESMNSMDSGLNCYDIGEHSMQMDNSEDVLRLDESDSVNYGEHHGYVEHEQHSNNIIMSSEPGLLTLDIDLDFVSVPSGAVRPTSIDIQRTATDYTPSDLSSGYITTSCMSHDDSQTMDLLFQQKLKGESDIN